MKYGQAKSEVLSTFYKSQVGLPQKAMEIHYNQSGMSSVFRGHLPGLMVGHCIILPPSIGCYTYAVVYEVALGRGREPGGFG